VRRIPRSSAAAGLVGVLACFVAGAAAAQTAPPATAPPPTQLDPVVVYGREDSLVGAADTASEGTVGAVQLEERAIHRPGEILEAVPGLIVTQHSGEGKANQFFLRGFNLDHGTDFATSIDGVPINLPTHGHGQGYTDLNFLIPELVERIDFRKGPYYADLGDFSSAGAANLEYFRSLPGTIVRAEGGMHTYVRGLLASSLRLLDGDLLAAIEGMHDDGPWEEPDDFRKLNGVLRYSAGNSALGWSATASAYAGKWHATDQIPERALHDLPGFGRFDSLDDSAGGESQKYMLYGEWHRRGEHSASRLLVYGFHQRLTLFSNFTYFLSSPLGDQFEQVDRRWVGGASGRHSWYGALAGFELESSLGLQVRSDAIENGLFQTVERNRVDKPGWDGGLLPATTRKDDVWQLSIAPHFESRIQWLEKLRSVAGVRLDYFHFDVDAIGQPGASGREDALRASPKASVIAGPWWETEVYLSGGMGFHSNDARGVTAPVDAADPLVRTYGAEVGVRTAFLPRLHASVAFWWLDIDSELLFVGDAGTTEASRPSRRYGIEIASYYKLSEWLSLDADCAISHARFRDDDPSGNHIPGSIESVVAAGATVRDLAGFSGELRLRYLGPRALVEDDDVRSQATVLLSARVGYALSPVWTLEAEVFNALDRSDSDIEYFYPSRLAGEPPGPDAGGYDDVHFHPTSSISVRAGVTARF